MPALTETNILYERSPVVLARHARDLSWRIRTEVARNHFTRPTTLDRLARDSSAAVRASVGRNLHSAPGTLLRLAGDSDPEVVEEVVANPNTPSSTVLQAVAGPTPPPIAAVASWVRRTHEPVPQALALRCLACADPEIRRVGIQALLRLAP